MTFDYSKIMASAYKYSKRNRRIRYLSKQDSKFMLIAFDEMIKCNFKGKLLAESIDAMAVCRNQMEKLAKQNEVRSRIIFEKIKLKYGL